VVGGVAVRWNAAADNVFRAGGGRDVYGGICGRQRNSFALRERNADRRAAGKSVPSRNLSCMFGFAALREVGKARLRVGSLSVRSARFSVP
jgi:hypothetical protein